MKTETHVDEGSKKNPLSTKSEDSWKSHETEGHGYPESVLLNTKKVSPRPIGVDESVEHENLVKDTNIKPKNGPERSNDNKKFTAGYHVSNSIDPREFSQNIESQSGHHDQSVPTEESPLLPGSDLENWAGVGIGVSERASELQSNVSRFVHNRRLWKIILYLMLLLLLMLALLALVDFQKLANEAFKTELQEISVLSINQRGVTFLVAGKVETNYENISNLFLRHVAHAGSLLVGGVIISPRNNCSVFVTTENVVGAHLLDIFPPEIAVDLIDHRTSDIEFISDAAFANGAPSIIKAILSHGFSNPLDLKVEARLSPKILGKWFSLNLKTASIFQEIKIPFNKQKLPLEISNLRVNDRNNRMEVGFHSGISPLPVTFSIGKVEWNVAIADCNMNPVITGDWVTSSISFSPDVETEFQVSGIIKEIPPDLLHICSNGLTPANHFARLIVNDKTLNAFIRAKNSELNLESLPEWLFKILSDTSLQVSLPIPHISGNSGNIFDYEYVIESSNILTETDENGDLKVLLDTNAYIGLNSPAKVFDINLSASKIKSKLTLLDSNKTLLEGLIPGSGNMYLIPQSSLSDKLYLAIRNFSASIRDPSLAGRYLNSILKQELVNIPDWAIDLEEMCLTLPLMSILLKDLQFKGEPTFQKKSIKNLQSNSKFLDWLLQRAEVLADQIFCVSSSPEHVELLVDFQITNPLNASVGVINDMLIFDLSYNGSSVGIVSLENFKVPDSKERILLTASLTLFYKSEPQRILLEDFISHVISGSENTFFGIAGSKPDSSNKETGLSKLLQEIDIDGMRLPELTFTYNQGSTSSIMQKRDVVNEDKIMKTDLELKQSPFLVDATFHLWSSEIELTVFNPLANMELQVKILSCLASYKGESLAHIEESEVLIIPPGIQLTPRIPIKISSGIGADILRKAINGNLAMDVVAELSVFVGQFPTDLIYRGSGLTAKVKI